MTLSTKINHTPKRRLGALGARSMIAGALIFGAGMCTGDSLRYRAASVRTNEELPRARVEYTREGTFVNGQPVSADGRLGLPRCDYELLSSDLKRELGVRAVQEQPGIIADYARQVGADAWKQLMYVTLGERSETNR